MSKKKLKRDGVYFTGEAANDVTGSQYLVRFGKYQCLLECGWHQSRSNDYLDSYKINSEKFKFNPKEIDYVFVCHTHIDHIGGLPRLVKEGFHGKIIATPNTAAIMKPLLLNSCYIVQEEAKIISKRYRRNYKPLYNEEDVYKTLGMIETYEEYGKIYELNDTIKFKWLKNSHCLGATQLFLILSDSSKTRKVLYTSDIGALNTDNHYVNNTEIPNEYADVVIMESTYGNPKRESKKTRKFDKRHLQTAVETVIDRGGSVIFPCFSFSRTQEILTNLFEIFGHDESFDTKVVVDSKLSCEICNLYSNLLTGSDLVMWEKVFNWKNAEFITEKTNSQISVADDTPKIIISSSGFCTNGRVVNYLKKHLSNLNSMIIFTGYTGDNPSYLSYQIKNYREHKFISINKEKIENKVDCITLNTFSSHAGHSDLVKYGSSLNTSKLVLVHGSEESKKALAEKLREAISRNNKTYKVVQSCKGMAVYF